MPGRVRRLRRGGLRQALPGAIQVSDRWHLWHNLAEYAEKTAARAPRLPEGAARAADAGDQDAPAMPDGSLDVCGRERQTARRTRERYAEIRERLDAGQPEAAIRRATGLDRRTVQRYARAASADELLAGISRESKLDEFKPYICQRWNQGLTDAAQIHAELAQRGWTGSPQTVRRYVHLLRKTGPAVTPAPAVPKTREITRWLLSRPASLDDGDQARLAAVRASCPHLDSLARHIRDFAEMMTRRQGLLALDDWLTSVEADDQPELHSLAAGIRRDLQAVTAGLTLPYSSAAVEGNVNRLILWNQDCQIGAAWAWRISTIGRMVALAGRSSCRGVGPAGVGMSASRSSSLSRAALPSSTAACSSWVSGIMARIFCRFSLASRSWALLESFEV